MQTSFSLAAIATLVFASTSSSRAVNVVISGTNNGEIAAFLNANFTNVTITASGDYSLYTGATTTAALAAGGGAQLVIFGRTLGSAAYGSFNAAGYNSLNIPLVSFTSYISRDLDNRMGWHTGSASHALSVTGAETTLSAAGAAYFDLTPGTADLFASVPGNTFNGLGSAYNVGGGTVLGTIGTDLQSAYWATGQAPGNPTAASNGNAAFVFPAPRLLFNLDNDTDPVTNPSVGEFTNLSSTGKAALITSLSKIGGLTPVPEPSAALLGLASLGLLGLRRRRS